MVGVSVTSPQELLDLRTELEILRQVRRQSGGPLSGEGEGAQDSVRHVAASASDLEDLDRILHDARSPLIEPMISVIDREAPELADQLPTSAIESEARNIVRDAKRMKEELHIVPPDAAAETGIEQPMNPTSASNASEVDARPTAGDPPTAETMAASAPATTTALESDLNQALAAAESCLQELTALTQAEPSTAGCATSSPSDPQDASSAVPCTQVSPSSEQAGASSTALEFQSPVDPRDVPPEADPAETAQTHPQAMPDDVAPLKPHVAAAPSDAADDALQAVQTIESGLVRLAEALHCEVRQRWQSAQKAFEDVAKRGEEVSGTLRDAQQFLDEILRAKERAEIARDDIDICRREAAHFREDARRAKERAEVSADAAASVADRAARELENVIRGATGERPDPHPS